MIFTIPPGCTMCNSDEERGVEIAELEWLCAVFVAVLVIGLTVHHYASNIGWTMYA